MDKFAFAPSRRKWPQRLSTVVLLLLTIAFLAPSAVAQQAIRTGPKPGAAIPAFRASDQKGQMRNLKSIMGPKGALLVFFRSADW
ncbi:MAG: hypothetical protein ACRD1J_08925 [Terriglobia bacterium]